MDDVCVSGRCKRRKAQCLGPCVGPCVEVSDNGLLVSDSTARATFKGIPAIDHETPATHIGIRPLVAIARLFVAIDRVATINTDSLIGFFTPLFPSTGCPSVECPSIECPSIECPSIGCPSVECPSVECNVASLNFDKRFKPQPYFLCKLVAEQTILLTELPPGRPPYPSV